MPTPYSRIALTSRSNFEDKEKVLKGIVDLIEDTGVEVCVDEERCALPSLKNYKKFKEPKDVDLIIVVGGDGTILRTVNRMKDFGTPLLTVNRGTLGFLTECDTGECEEVISELLSGSGILEERAMLACNVIRDGQEIIKGHALNEVVISQGAIARLFDLKTKVNGVLLTTFRADGIIISTPTGSTAYNLAAGGPIVHPHCCDTIITPINAHTLSKKPLAVPSDTEIEVEIILKESSRDDVKISLTLDGQTHYELEKGDRVTVGPHAEKIRFLKRKEDAFYETLRGKLGWGE